MNKKLYLIVFLGFLAISFYPYHKSNFVISANKKFVNDTVKALTKEDIMGKYVSVDEYTSYEINIQKDTFNSKYADCTSETMVKGKWAFKNDILYLSEVYSKEDIDSIFSQKEDETYRVIRQDSSIILINNWGDKYINEVYRVICRLHNSGLKGNYGYFPSKKLEIQAPVSIPTIPKEYHKFLLKKIITCQVIAIESDTTLTINAGKKDGIFEELILSKVFFIETPKKQERYFGRRDMIEFLKVEIIKCNDSISKAKITHKRDFWEYDFQTFVPNIKKLKVGDTLHSYYEK
jgi:hypothetical protein